MRVLLALAATAMLAPAQSHPSWWNWASPDATALVGVHWETVRLSPLAEALASEVGPDGDLGLPNLDCLKQSKQLLFSSPAFLVVASGDFSAQELRTEAVAQAMKPMVYKDVDVWISPGKSTLSVARISDQVLLLGFLRNLEAAIDRNQAQPNQGSGERRYSPLLKRAARFQGQDLWVIATQLPDPLASRLVPLDVEARGFEGSMNLGDGIRLEGTLAAASQDEAAGIAAKLQQLAPGLPSIARGLQVVQAGDMVVLAMVATSEQVAASLRTAPATAPSATVKEAAAPKVQVAAASVAASVAAKVVAKVAPPPASATPADAAPTTATLGPSPVAAVPPGPRVVRILGLDDGPREIVLPPAVH